LPTNWRHPGTACAVVAEPRRNNCRGMRKWAGTQARIRDHGVRN